MEQYNPKKIEEKWQKYWEKNKFYQTKDFSKKPKYYCLVEFPYPSGEGLHIGHTRSYTAMDIIVRKRRMEGYNVLFPIGWDAFGLPTENYALKTGIHPRVATKKNTDNFRRQLKSLGFSFDWNREINTTDPNYYKWTQWVFLQFFKKGLAYKKKMPINWCLSCKIGLANEEVVNGRCERCGGATEKREKEQWMLAITKYADRLLKDLEKVDYLEKIKIQQQNWIGKSEGAEIDFSIKNSNLKLKIFTTRPDTLFGATYMVLAPEHEIIRQLAGQISNLDEVENYIKEAKKKSELQRTDLAKEKTGVELKGIKAINPVNKKEIPIFIADYVLSTYGTGAIMAVPAHDERDFEFAKKFKLPIKRVIEPCFTSTTGNDAVRKELPFIEREAIMAIVKHWSEDKYIGLKWKKVDWQTLITGGPEKDQTPEKGAIEEIIEETGYLHPKLIRRLERVHSKFFHVPKNINRFAHFSVFYFELQDGKRKEISQDDQNNHEVVWLSPKEMEEFLTPESQLFVWKEFHNGTQVYTGDGIMVNSDKFNGMDSEKAKWEITKFVGGKKQAQYHLRDWIFSRQHYWGEPIPIIHCDKCGDVPVPEKDLPVKLPEVKKYQPTDTGESPLANIKNWVNTKCPVCKGPAKRETDTMPNWAGSSWYFLRYADPKAKKNLADKKKLNYWMPVDWYNGGMEHVTLHLLYSRFWNKFLYDIGIVPVSEPYKKRTSQGMILGEDGEKMSKSRGNVVNPDEVVRNFGADAYRIYLMFMGPFDQAIPWDSRGIEGVRRFLNKIWKLRSKTSPSSTETLLHKTIKKVTKDIEEMKFNTAISQLMILVNEIEKNKELGIKNYEMFLKLFAPFAPHLAEELWHELGNKKSIFIEPWPKYDPRKTKEGTFELVVQINGKVRDRFEAPMGILQKNAQELTLERENVKKYLNNKKVKKVIFVPNRLINYVCS